MQVERRQDWFRTFMDDESVISSVGPSNFSSVYFTLNRKDSSSTSTRFHSAYFHANFYLARVPYLFASSPTALDRAIQMHWKWYPIRVLICIYETILGIIAICVGVIFNTLRPILLPILLILSPILLILGCILKLFGVGKNTLNDLDEDNHATLLAYLNHFTYLYPNLIRACELAHKRNHRQDNYSQAKWWPVKVQKVPKKSTQYTFSWATWLFWQLNEAGWPRKALLEFLRDRVEWSNRASEEEKAKFANLMTRMFPPGKRIPNNDWLTDTFLPSRKYPPPEKNAVPLGENAYYMKGDSLEWLLHEGAFLVPEDRKTRNRMQSIVGMLPAWKKLTQEKDLEMGYEREGYWQVMDLRSI